MPNNESRLIDLTHPLRRSIETGEGVLVYATNAVLYLAALLPHGLSWTHAGLFVVILNSVHAFQRGLLKAVAIATKVGLTPTVPAGLPPIPEAPVESQKAA